MTPAHTPTTEHTPLTHPVTNALNSAEQSARHMAEQVAALSRQSVHAVQAGGHQLSDTLHNASDKTVGYIRNEPVKSVLMAVALGATLVTVFHLISRPHHTHR